MQNAAEILDKYITKTLNRDSKVVTNWIDAIFQQKIDFKSSVTEQIQAAQLPERHEIAETAENCDENLSLIPEKKENSESKKSEDIDPQKAAELNNKALTLMKMAQNFDENNNLSQALNYYNNSLELAKNSGNKEIQAQAHDNMASIYDDAGMIGPALEHYHAALSFDGEIGNVKEQAQILNSIGNLFTVKKEYKKALTYYKISYSLADDQNDDEGRGSVLSNIASAFKELGYDKKALNYYKESVKCDLKIGNIQGYAKSCEQSGDIMLKNKKLNKAGNLYRKSLDAARETGDRTWFSKIVKKIDQTIT